MIDLCYFHGENKVFPSWFLVTIFCFLLVKLNIYSQWQSTFVSGKEVVVKS